MTFILVVHVPLHDLCSYPGDIVVNWFVLDEYLELLQQQTNCSVEVGSISFLKREGLNLEVDAQKLFLCGGSSIPCYKLDR